MTTHLMEAFLAFSVTAFMHADAFAPTASTIPVSTARTTRPVLPSYSQFSATRAKNDMKRAFPLLHYQIYDSQIDHVLDQQRFDTSLLELSNFAELSDEFGLDTTTLSSLFEQEPSLDDVRLSFLPSNNHLNTDKALNTLPLVISPKLDTSLKFLATFLERHRPWIHQMVAQYGAVLFRGFDIVTAKHVETAILHFEPQLNNQYHGTSPRNTVDNTNYVFSAAEVPSHFPIAQHLEMSFLPAPPRRLFFSALKAPLSKGGETALADFGKVYQDLPSALRNKLMAKKLKYTRTHGPRGAKFTTDVASLQSWSDVFGTTDKQQVERIAVKSGMPVQWKGRNRNIFVSEFTSEPFQLHPDTMRPIWFNHAQVFHWTTFPSELWFAFQRTKDWRFFFRAATVGLQSVVVYGLLRRKMALHVSFGDGTPISFLEMQQIRKAVHRNMVFQRWQQGDLLLIDNFAVSHGRQPTYDAGRKIVVSWSDPLEKANDVFGDMQTIVEETEG